MNKRIFPMLVVIALAIGAAGCKQSEGEPCEFNEECGGGLVCCQADPPDFRGICLAEGAECPARATDGGVDGGYDAGPFDAGPDAGVDAGPVPFDAGRDAGMTDAGMTDAGMTDAGTDAGMIDAGPP